MAAKDQGEKKKGGGLLGMVATVVGLTVLAGGGGLLLGRQITVLPTGAHKPDGAGADAAASATPASTVRELMPIVANLAAPEGAWMRLQTAIVYDKSDAAGMDLIASKVTDDTIAFIKTLSVSQVEGASGLQHLREDLNERAAVRSDGKVKEMMIEMMVIQ